MDDLANVSNDGNDGWSEIVTVQTDNHPINALISVRTLRISSGPKEHHVRLSSDDEDCFLYRTIINLDEYRRLALSNNFIASFDNLPQYIRQLLRAAKQENEYGQSYFINLLSPTTLGFSQRIELLITTRQSGHVIQNKVLCIPMTSASDAEFKEHLTQRFEQLKKEKDQLRRSASFLESQLRAERARSRELEDKNNWFRKELKVTQNLLKSAENIQKHYEVILSLRHRGETGSTVVTIPDCSPSRRIGSAQGNSSSIDSNYAEPISIATADSGSSSSTVNVLSPPMHKESCSFSQISDDDECQQKSTKRKVSMYNAADSDSDDQAFRRSIAVQSGRPPPRKYAAAVPFFDDGLMRIRKEEEQRRSSVRTSEEEGGGQRSDNDGDWSPPINRRRKRSPDDAQSPLLPSPLVQRALSPPAVVTTSKMEDPISATTSNDAMSNRKASSTQTPGPMFKSSRFAPLECPGDTN